MTTESSHHRTRADSGVDSMKPTSKNLDNLKKFWEVVSSLANGENCKTLGDLIEHVAFQEEEVRKLNMRLVAQKEYHENFHQEQLSRFEERYRRWQEVNSVLESEAKHSVSASKEKDKKIQALQKELENHEIQITDSKKTCSAMTQSLEEKDRQLTELGARLQTAEMTNKDHTEKLKKAHSDTNSLKNLLKDEEKTHLALQAEFDKMKGKLQEFQQFSVRTKDLDLTEVLVVSENISSGKLMNHRASKLDFLWKSVAVLVVNFFGQDLSVEILQVCCQPDAPSLKQYP